MKAKVPTAELVASTVGITDFYLLNYNKSMSNHITKIIVLVMVALLLASTFAGLFFSVIQE
ncbi:MULTISPECIES: hypothetical protein [unclassified Prochlorococcus]|uniref:hypothetical protein n=1 Tax=unclassified Prochlorococcus TaxID=2627481 RepID=UPI0005339DE4|nr:MULTISPECIES: hypothetical protein [unclassified Prochlorococcus]KGG14913.1 hypothetical protein EV06_1976 [Prochlorococcus sp. MIT 0602]KGG15654.1 hypothetical protein EV07_1619 [Prochlorococcus sp. MIT 0603]